MTDAPKPAKLGRKPAYPPRRRVIVMLSEADQQKARDLGGGSLSQGIREAIARVRLPFEAPS